MVSAGRVDRKWEHDGLRKEYSQYHFKWAPKGQGCICQGLTKIITIIKKCCANWDIEEKRLDGGLSHGDGQEGLPLTDARQEESVGFCLSWDVRTWEKGLSQMTHKLWAWMTGKMVRLSAVIKEGSSREGMMWGRLQVLSHPHWIWVDRQSSTRNVREASPELKLDRGDRSWAHRWICHRLHRGGSWICVCRWNYTETWKGAESEGKEDEVQWNHHRK